jgi:dihydrofolate synthase / folylpolyglutamate synthase
MQFIPVKTKIFLPPQDDLWSELDTSLPPLYDGDVVLISSKVVAISEGRCVQIEGADKTKLVEREADYVIPTDYRPQPLTIKNHTFLGAAGIDESNGNGFYILLPEDCFVSAEKIHQFLLEKYSLKNLGVIITDSRSLPLRYGASGVALGWWGIAPLQNHIGSSDLFGRAFKYERSNIVDGIAAAANLVSGETDECMPIVIARDIPNLVFKSGDTRAELFSSLEDDTFRVLYRDVL